MKAGKLKKELEKVPDEKEVLIYCKGKTYEVKVVEFVNGAFWIDVDDR